MVFPQPRHTRSGFGIATVGAAKPSFASRRCCWVSRVGIGARPARDVVAQSVCATYSAHGATSLPQMDVGSPSWALFNQSFSLKTLCQQLKTKHQKLDHEPTGKVTPEEIEYARQDGRCTVDALNGLMQEFDQHPIRLKPYHAYSPASVAKGYLGAMGIVTPAAKFKLSEKRLRHRHAELLRRAIRNARALRRSPRSSC